VIADDQALVRSGFRLIVEGRPDLEVVGEADDGEAAVALVRELEPDVILLDIRVPNLDGIEATKQIVASGSNTRILVLTTFDLDEYVYGAVRAGASGFLLKDVRPGELVDAIRVVASGNALLGPTAVARLLQRFSAPVNTTPVNTTPVNTTPVDAAMVGSLTGRETETLRLLAGGLSNSEIAATLVVSETTVKTHVSNLLRKLGVRDRVQAVIAAYDAGVARPKSPPSGGG
jgi:DNA-binding NarL/FixJ family response regulator